MRLENAPDRTILQAGGVPVAAIAAWLRAVPEATGVFAGGARSHGGFWRLSDELVTHLPKKPARAAAQVEAAAAIFAKARELREQFLRTHVEAVYAAITHDFSRFVRVEDLVFAAADVAPGLVPTRAQVAAEAELLQRDKDGREIDQGILLAHVLAHARAGRHLCHAMLLPRPEAEENLARLAADGVIDLGPARVERRGRAAYLTARN